MGNIFIPLGNLKNRNPLWKLEVGQVFCDIFCCLIVELAKPRNIKLKREQMSRFFCEKKTKENHHDPCMSRHYVD